ncbi:F-box protein [Enterobacter sp. 56-7]
MWHLIINNLDRKGLARASMTCSTFRNIVETWRTTKS